MTSASPKSGQLSDEVDVSVIVPAWNAAPHIRCQLQALACQDYSGEWEVIVADNGSDDATHEIVAQSRELLRNLQLVDASHRRGAASARNRGAQAARGRYLAFCDADDVVAPWWLRGLMSDADRHSISYGRFVFFRGDPPSPGVCKEEVARQKDATLLTQPFGYLPFASSGSMIVDRVVFERLNGFDETYRTGEDVDFCWRAQYAGYTLGLAPQALAYIRLRDSPKSQFRQYRGYGRGEVRLYLDHARHGMPRSSVVRAFAVYGWLAAVGIVALVRRDPYYRFWVNALGRRCGRLSASLQYRRIYL